jgi:hypothetical protein
MKRISVHPCVRGERLGGRLAAQICHEFARSATRESALTLFPVRARAFDSCGPALRVDCPYVYTRGPGATFLRVHCEPVMQLAR